MKRWLLVCSLIACGPSVAAPVVVLVPPQPGLAGARRLTVPTASPTDNALACVVGERGTGDKLVPVAHPPDAQSPMAGQMTEQAAQAKRLFDAERWHEAEQALARVASGESGDDEGNKELAQYHLGVAQFRLKSYDAALATFADITKDRLHLKWDVTVLWATKLAETDFPGRAHAVDLLTILGAPHCRGEKDPFNNPSQIRLRSEVLFLTGRGALRAGDQDLARACFARLAPDDDLRPLADACVR